MDENDRLSYQTDLELWKIVFSKSLLLFVTILAGGVVADFKNIVSDSTSLIIYGFMFLYLLGVIMMFITLKVTLKNKIPDPE